MLQLALLVERAQSRQSFGKTFPRNVHEVAIDGVAGGNVELRKRGCYFLQAHVAALGDIEGSRENFGGIFEDAVHLVVVLDEELSAVKFHPRGIVNRLSRL